MNEINSPTRRYVASSPNVPECCENNEHSSIQEALDCILLKESNKFDVGIDAIDWAFGVRAIVPTFGNEWQEIHKYKIKLP
jgi:hypothetical protein